MQHHHLDHNGDVAPISIEHLDLVTAELRRRIAGIGLAIAELREETGRLRASADSRYHAVAVLDRPPMGDAAAATVVDLATPATVPPAAIPGSTAAVAASDVSIEAGVAEPASPWREAPVTVVDAPPVVRLEPVSAPNVSDADADAASPTPVSGSTWVPEPGRVAAGTRDAVSTGSAGEATRADSEQSLWGDEDDDDAAAFDAFFSAEIEPEPSQRWLLSD